MVRVARAAISCFDSPLDEVSLPDQYESPIDIELRDMHINAGDGVAFATSLQRISGTLKNGQKSDLWVRVTNGFRKINGRWLDTHDHVSVPADLASGKAVLDLKP